MTIKDRLYVKNFIQERFWLNICPFFGPIFDFEKIFMG